MKAKDLAEELMKHPDFDVRFHSTTTINDQLYWVFYNVFGILDHSYSEKVIVLGGIED
jgi:hypothetical protein